MFGSGTLLFLTRLNISKSIATGDVFFPKTFISGCTHDQQQCPTFWGYVVDYQHINILLQGMFLGACIVLRAHIRPTCVSGIVRTLRRYLLTVLQSTDELPQNGLNFKHDGSESCRKGLKTYPLEASEVHFQVKFTYFKFQALPIILHIALAS